MSKANCFLLLVLACSIGVPARADIIDFETGVLLLSNGDTGILQGFHFTAGGLPSAAVAAPLLAANCIPDCVSNGTKTLGAINGATVTIDPILPGELFSLDSFDVAGTATSGSTRNATSIKVIGNLFGGGQVTETFLMNPDAFQTLTLDSSFAGLTSVEFDGLTPIGPSSPEFQLDNITYHPAAGTTTPEPASWLLATTGLLVAIRRKLPSAHGSKSHRDVG